MTTITKARMQCEEEHERRHGWIYSHSHTKEYRRVLLIDHLKSVSHKAVLEIKASKWVNPKYQELAVTIARIAGLYHDVGKAMGCFQRYLLDTEDDKNTVKWQDPEWSRKKEHSQISGICTFYALHEALKHVDFITQQQRDRYAVMGYMIVDRHHSSLDQDFSKYTLALSTEDSENIRFQWDDMRKDIFRIMPLPYWKEVEDHMDHLVNSDKPELNPTKGFIDMKDVMFMSEQEFHLELFAMQIMLYSAILSGDKMSAAHLRTPARKAIPADIVDKYEKKMFAGKKGLINKLRTQAYKETVAMVDKIDLHKFIYSLILPTGLGKTLAISSFAIKLAERIKQELGYRPRIIYCMPFLSIIDQSYAKLREVFGNLTRKNGYIDHTIIVNNDILETHTHFTNTRYEKHSGGKNNIFDQNMHIEGWDSEFITTTFVQFFHSLFALHKNLSRKVNRITGSIVILDEVQSLPCDKWHMFAKFVNTISEMTGTYFLLSTATSPGIFGSDGSIDLLPDHSKYFSQFHRTDIIPRIDDTITISQLGEEVAKRYTQKPEQKMLLVVNKVKDAEVLYKDVRSRLPNARMFFLSTMVVPKERLARIRKIKSITGKQGYIVVTTQLIEAGVDIDADMAIRDMAPFDNIIQVTGRVNRNNEKNIGTVEIVRIRDDGDKIEHAYQIYNQVQLSITLDILNRFKGRKITEPEYEEIINEYFGKLKLRMKEIDKPDRNATEAHVWISSMEELKNEEMNEFTIIDKDPPRAGVFIETEDKASSEVLDAYAKMKSGLFHSFLARKRRWMQIKNRFQQYVVEIPVNSLKALNLLPDDYDIKSRSFVIIPKSKRRHFYDLTTGFYK